VIDRARDAWRWLTEDLDSAVAADELSAVAEMLTSAERTAVVLIRVGFSALEATMFLGAFAVIPGVAGGLMRSLTLGWALALGICMPLLAWFFARKPRALVESALLGSVTRRAAARMARHTNLVFDSTSASGAPVAVSADVDHGT
jgi:hypothetical protein